MPQIGLAVGSVLTAGTIFFAMDNLQSVDYEHVSTTVVQAEEAASPAEIVAPKVEPPVDTREVVQHQPMPEAVKAIYMSACVVGTKDFRQRLVNFVNETEVNSLVIDIKDYSGAIAFDPVDDSWQYAWDAAKCGANDMKEFLAFLHEQGIYIIGRVTVFQDPLLTKRRPDLAVKKLDNVTNWKDYKGLSFIDVGAREYWDHMVQLTVESYNVGFDEINYDYVRYPSDGPMSDISFPHSLNGEYGADKQANLEAFFAYLHKEVGDESKYQAVRHENTGRASTTPYTSADLFGMTTTNYDDLSIGQLQERALPYFDAIAPMVYPSHYPDGSFGYPNPNDVPYQIVNYAMAGGVERALATTTTLEGFTHTPLFTTNASGTKIATGSYTKQPYDGNRFRTWIQDFDYGGDYDAADVRAQIQASYDAGVDSWMVWAPSNVYTRGGYLGAQ